jgi:hypothetical protein
MRPRPSSIVICAATVLTQRKRSRLPRAARWRSAANAATSSSRWGRLGRRVLSVRRVRWAARRRCVEDDVDQRGGDVAGDVQVRLAGSLLLGAKRIAIVQVAPAR